MVCARCPLSESFSIPQPLHFSLIVPLDCSVLEGVEDPPGGFRGVEGVFGSLIAARPCETPDIGVVG